MLSLLKKKKKNEVNHQKIIKKSDISVLKGRNDEENDIFLKNILS